MQPAPLVMRLQALKQEFADLWDPLSQAYVWTPAVDKVFGMLLLKASRGYLTGAWRPGPAAFVACVCMPCTASPICGMCVHALHNPLS